MMDFFVFIRSSFVEPINENGSFTLFGITNYNITQVKLMWWKIKAIQSSDWLLGKIIASPCANVFFPLALELRRNRILKHEDILYCRQIFLHLLKEEEMTEWWNERTKKSKGRWIVPQAIAFASANDEMVHATQDVKDGEYYTTHNNVCHTPNHALCQIDDD